MNTLSATIFFKPPIEEEFTGVDPETVGNLDDELMSGSKIIGWMKINYAKEANVNQNDSESESNSKFGSKSISISHYEELSTKEAPSKRKTTLRQYIKSGKVFPHPRVGKVSFVTC